MKLDTKSLFEIRMVSSLNFFKRANRSLCTITQMDEKENTYITHIYVVSRTRLLQITHSGKRNYSPKFSPEYSKFAFLSDRDGKTPQIYVYDFDAEAFRITDEKGNILDFTWADEDTIYYVVSEKTKRNSPYGKESDVKEITKLFYKFDNLGYLNNLRYVLKKVDLKTRKVSTLRRFSNSLNGLKYANGRLYFVSNLDPNSDRVFYNFIYEYDPENGTLGKVIKEKWFISSFEVQEDGIYFLANTFRRGLADIPNFYVLREGELEKLSELDRTPSNTLNSDARFGSGRSFKVEEGRIYFRMTVGGRCGLFVLHDGKVEEVEFGDFSVEDFDVREGRIITVRSYFNRPTEIYLEGTKITRLNDRFVRKYKLKTPERITFRASDGKEVEGWILKPYNRSKKRGGKLPAILEIHGGPRTAYGHAFMFEFHLLAHSGYYVMFSNPRGSDGYGFEFANEIVGNYGDRDFKDIMEFVDHVLENYKDIDEERLGITGGSYGGFMTNWVVGHTKRFRCAITQRSISNWISFYGTSDIGWLFGKHEIGTTPFEDIQKYWDKSPLKYVENIETPLLIIHSENDYRCPLEQAEQLFVALRKLGKPVEMIIFPDEGHELSRSGKPKHRVERLHYIRSWFNRYL